MKRQLIRLPLNKSTAACQQLCNPVAFKRSVYSNFLENNFSTCKLTNCRSPNIEINASNLESNNTIVRNYTSFSDNVCHSCGKSLRSLPTINGNSKRTIFFKFTLANGRFLHCLDCNMLYTTSSRDSSQKYNISKPTEQYFCHPPYPTEVVNHNI